MNKKWLLVLVAMLVVGLLFIGCPNESEDPTPPSVNWVNFPDDEIANGVAFGGLGVYDAGKAEKLGDGTWKVTVKYSKNNEKSFFAFGGPATFKKDFSVEVELPADATDKPTRFILMATPALPTDNDPQAGADWGSAFDKQEAAISGTFVASNEGKDGNSPTTDMHTLDIWLYFDQSKEGTYTFFIKEAKAGDLTAVEAPAASQVVVMSDPYGGWATNEIDFIPTSIANLDYRGEKNFATAFTTNALEVDVVAPADAVGKTYEFLVRPLLHESAASNVIDATMMQTAYIFEGNNAITYPRQNSVATTVAEKPGYYKIAAKMVQYGTVGGVTNGYGAKLMIPMGTAKQAIRYIVIVNLPKGFAQ